MNKTLINTIAAAVLLLLSATAAQAATLDLWLTPAYQDSGPPPLGEAVSLDLMMNFAADPTLGGGVEIHYDPTRLDFGSWDFNDGSDPVNDPFPDDDSLSLVLAPGDTHAGHPQPVEPGRIILGFGNFVPLAGPFRVGTLALETLGITGPTFVNLVGNDIPAGDFLSANTFAPQVPVLQGAEVNIIPLPAAVWMLLGGLGILGAGSRRKSATA